jgi:hypothetical protein
MPDFFGSENGSDLFNELPSRDREGAVFLR